MRYIWLIPLLPRVGAAINGLLGIRAFSRRTAGVVACTTMTAALGLSLFAFWQLLGLKEDARAFDITVAQWIPRIPLQTNNGVGLFEVTWGFRLDPLSGLMLLVVTGVGTLIHVYSTGYMADEPRGGVARFFCYLNLFCFFMLMLVLGNNFLVMFVGWEGVGLCSYLLIGYWYEKKSASDAGKKAFIMNRIGDWGFILGVFLVFTTFGTFDFREVQNAAAAMPIESTHFGVLSFICLLLFVGAAGKSAQIPLYVWLPDAMEGPTPVSALIHAATMVTAGVYMVGRNALLFSHAPMVMQIVAIVGVLTALMTAFYMFRLMALTFLGVYRGPAWETTGRAAAAVAATHAAPRPADAYPRGQAHRQDHEVSRGPAGPHDHSPGEDSAHDAHGSGHGHGPWHGPHESPTPMLFPLMVLAIGAVVAGFVGIPAALGGPNAIEGFLEPSFSATTDSAIADRGMRIAVGA